MKTCSICKIEKPLGDYYARQTKCKPCQIQYQKQWVNTNTDKVNSWREKNKDTIKIYGKEYATQNAKILDQKHKEWKHKSKGVYGMFEGGKCLYVGESNQINKRFTNHKHYIKHPDNKNGHPELYYSLQQHNHIIFGILEECENHKDRERYFIDMYNPVYNT